jgi:hypothetical protein
MGKMKEKAIDVQNMLRELEHLCMRHDWNYSETTNENKLSIGRSEHRDIVHIIMHCKDMGAGEAAQSIYDSYTSLN